MEDTIGKILKPSEGDRIERIIEVQIKILRHPPNLHFWVATQHDSNLIWFREREIKKEYEILKIDFGHPTEGFKILLLACSNKGQCTIENWYRYGVILGNYPGLKIEDIDGGKIIDNIIMDQ